jgi:hypothetical protein
MATVRSLTWAVGRSVLIRQFAKARPLALATAITGFLISLAMLPNGTAPFSVSWVCQRIGCLEFAVSSSDTLLGLPIAEWGVAWWGLVLWQLWIRPASPRTPALAAAGAMFSLGLSAAQIYSKTWCPPCAVICLGALILCFVTWRPQHDQ